jgi:Ca2+-binding RTX toxin-like protein
VRKGREMKRALLLGLLVAAAAVLVALVPSTTSAGHVTCFGSRTTIDGTSGPDRIFGTWASDVIASFAGNDEVHGLGGYDLICAGRGSDTLYDGYGPDRINGGDGYDTLYLCPDGAYNTWVNVERVVQSSLGCR